MEIKKCRYGLLVLVVAASLCCLARGQARETQCEEETYQVEEGRSVEVCFSVGRNGRIDTAQLTTVDGTATGREDFMPVNDNVVLMDVTDGRVCRDITTLADDEIEEEESFTVRLTGVGLLIMNASCTVVIADIIGPQLECFAGGTTDESITSSIRAFREDYCFETSPLDGMPSCGPQLVVDNCTYWNEESFTQVQAELDAMNTEDSFLFSSPPGCMLRSLAGVMRFLFSLRGSCTTNCTMTVPRDNCTVSYILLEDVRLENRREDINRVRTEMGPGCFDLQCCPCALDLEDDDEEFTDESRTRALGVAVGASVAGLFVVVVVLTSIIILVVLLVRRRSRRPPQVEGKSKNSHAVVYKPKKGGSTDDLVGTSGPATTPTDYVQITHTVNTRSYQEWRRAFASLIKDPSLLHFGDPLGGGAFGAVFKGTLSSTDGHSATVAIKTLKNMNSPNEKEIEDFLSESALMLNMDHPNVMKLIGICFDTQDLIPVILLPFMANGDIRSYLLAKRTSSASNSVAVYPKGLTEAILMQMCYDIASGMEYLARCRFVHRDLAARNCMIDDKLIVKIADFGLSRDVYHSDYYRLTHTAKLPVKWMPPESLYDNVFNEKTDIWSFGVVCWEIFSLGHKPYPGVDNADIPEYISNGNRLKKPVLCPDQLFEVLQNAWNLEAEERPSFSQVVKAIADITGFEADRQTNEHGYFVLDRKSSTDLREPGRQDDEDEEGYFIVNHRTTPLVSSSETLNSRHSYFTLASSNTNPAPVHTQKQDTENTYFVLENKSHPSPPNDEFDDNLYADVDYTCVDGDGAIPPVQDYEVPTTTVPSHSNTLPANAYEVPVVSTGGSQTDVRRNKNVYHTLEPQKN